MAQARITPVGEVHQRDLELLEGPGVALLDHPRELGAQGGGLGDRRLGVAREAAAQEGYLTSPKRQVLPEYGQGVTMSPEVQKQLQQTQSAPQTSGGSQPFVGNK